MKFNQLIKPFVASCLVTLSLVAQADDKMNFVTLRVGADQPTIYDNNAMNVQGLATGILGSLELGRKLNNMFALGVEYQYHAKTKFNMTPVTDTNTPSSSWAVKSDVLLATATVTLVQDAKILPYIKLGLGASKNRPSNYIVGSATSGGVPETTTYPSKNKTNFAWQLGVGLDVPMDERFDVDIAYAFLNRGTVSTQAYSNTPINNATASPNVSSVAQTVKLRDHMITLGIKFKF